MATITLAELLQPQFVLNLISRIRPGQGQIGRWLGFQPNQYNPETVTLNGPATVSGDLRNVIYRTFNAVRSPANGRAPGTGPGTIAENPMGQVQVACARFHEKIPLNYEMLGNLSPMIGPNSQIDPTGQNYVKQQSTFLARRCAMMIEMMSAGMMRNSLYLIMQGDNWLPSFTAPSSGPYIQINFQIPTGNTGQLNMLGGGPIITTSWANLGADIFGNLMSIKAAFAQLHGYPLTDVWIKSIARPFLNQTVKLLGNTFAIEREERGAAFRVVGRSLPVAVTDVRGSRKYILKARTDTADAATDLDLLLASGDILFLHAPPGSVVPTGGVFLMAGPVLVERPAPPSLLQFTNISVVEVAAPGPDVVGTTATWQTVIGGYATWSALIAAKPSWGHLLDLVGDPSEVLVP